MTLRDIGMVAANTARSRIYIQGLIQHNLMPSYVLILGEQTSELLPGQNPIDKESSKQNPHKEAVINTMGLTIKPSAPLCESLEHAKIPYGHIASHNINSEQTISHIAAKPENHFIYSGYGGAILREGILNIGKTFLPSLSSVSHIAFIEPQASPSGRVCEVIKTLVAELISSIALSKSLFSTIAYTFYLPVEILQYQNNASERTGKILSLNYLP